MKYIEITDFTGIKRGGFLTKKLPSTAKFIDCFYDEKLNMYSVYRTSSRYYFLKSKI